MPDRWFQVPESDAGPWPDLPEDIDGYTGHSYNGKWIVRVYAIQSILNEISNTQGVKELDIQKVRDVFSNIQKVSTNDISNSFEVRVK